MIAPPADLLRCAVAASRAAGTHAAANLDRRKEALQRTKHDIKLALDQECQTIATDIIMDAYPSSSVLGEEDPVHAPAPAQSALQWIVDPIDGTVNFSHGLPLWCSSIAVRQGNRILAGAVYAPMLGELYAATCETPATCNEAPLKVSNTTSLSDAMLGAGLSQKLPEERHMAVMANLRRQLQKIRVMGSAALDICRVAAGQLDLYWESGIYIWDVAAAGLIVQQAGGQTQQLEDFGGHRMSYMASNGLLHAPFRDILEHTLSTSG